MRTEALSLEGEEGSTSSIPVSSIESTREETSSMTGDSSYSDLPHLPPLASLGLSGFWQGEHSTSLETVSTMTSWETVSTMGPLSPIGEIALAPSERDCAGTGM